MAGGDINSSISAMLPTNEPFVASNTSSVYNDSGTSNTSDGIGKDKFQLINSSPIGITVFAEICGKLQLIYWFSGTVLC